MKLLLKYHRLFRGLALMVAISLLSPRAAAIISDEAIQTQDHNSSISGSNNNNTTADSEQQQSIANTAATQAVDISHLQIDSREPTKQDATTPISLSTVARQPAGQWNIQHREPSFGARGLWQRKLSQPDLSRLGGNYRQANYSQPFDAQPAGVVYRNYLEAKGEQQLPAPSGRALNSAAPPTIVADSHGAASYAYLPAPSQRVQHSTSTTSGGIENGANLVLDEPTSYGQENVLDYTPPLQHAHSAVAPSRVHYQPNLAGMSGRQSSVNPGDSLAHFMASPSLNSPGYDDYYAGPSSDLGHGDSYNLARNSPFNVNSSGAGYDLFDYPHYASSLSSSASPLDSYHQHHSPSRSRWSWPWTDVSSYYGYPSNREQHPHLSPTMTSASFKKHYHHHHHLPAKHKEHDHHHHHDEHELLSKWEHGISIGEIACVAVAVVLGIIILGSPFFLLFLMLFNGGNLFGTTQMGLLAPATVQGGTAGVAGRRRRRKRSPADTSGDPSGAGLNPKDIEAKYKELGVAGVTEYLFQKLSPMLDSGKLLQSFQRIMEVKDDIEGIVSKLAKLDQSKGGWTGELDHVATHQHTEMRRKRRR